MRIHDLKMKRNKHLFSVSIFLVCLFGWFLSLEGKSSQIQKKIIYTYIFLELEKYVRERDKHLLYFPVPPLEENCETVKVFYQDIPWDTKGIYPAPFLDVKVLCKPFNQKIILVIGDSISAGASLGREKTYPSLLNQSFEETFFLNAAINGSNTYHWRRGGILFEKVVTQNKSFIDGVILLIGGNNILFIEHVLKQKAKPQEITNEILALVQELQEELPNIPIYVGNYPVPHVMSKKMYEALEELRLNTKNTRQGPEVRSHFEKRWDLLMQDYLHLNEKGQRLMALLWEKRLREDGWK